MSEKKKLISIYENPFILFNKWFLEAKKHEPSHPNAMNLATVGKNLRPSSRMVLLKSYDNSGFIFYTNTNSSKGITINENSKIALNFYWKSLSKQIRIEGIAKIVSNIIADEYFQTRPINSQISAWASNQSKKLKDRKELISRFNKYTEKFKKNKISRPDYWSGYKVMPKLIEFWQEMPFRLHDRVEFKKKGNSWIGTKLFP